MSSRQTPLDGLHRDLGATMVDFAGWSMPLRYGSETAEHLAVRHAAGLFDLTHMGEIEVVGADAGALLDHAVVSSVGGLADGKAKYTMICREDGGILDDLIVYRLGAAHFLVVANAANSATVLDALAARSAGYSASVEDRRDAWALLAVQGPEAVGILGGLTSTDLAGVRYYAIAAAVVAGVDVLLARTGYTGEDGFELFVEPSRAEELWLAVTAAGAGRGLVVCGLACRDTLRLEAGMPLYGNELSVDLTPFDAGLGRVVALDKPGEWVGRDALIEASGRAGRRSLVGVVPEGRRVPRHGYRVDAPDGSAVGEVTSGAPSPTLGRPVAMAYLDADFAAPGTQVAVDVRGTPEPGRVTALPFYRRER